jgi:hypothetical protein
MDNEFQKFMKLLKITKPAKHKILLNNNVEEVYDGLIGERQKKAFLVLVILLTFPDYRKKFLESKKDGSA